MELEMGISPQPLPWQMEKRALRLTQGHCVPAMIQRPRAG